MNKDYAVWNIDRLLEMYKEIPDWKVSVDRRFQALFVFYEKNGLLTCRVTDDDGRVVKRVIMNSELTPEGNLLCSGSRSAVGRWLDSKGSQKDPPDMKILEKALAEIRGSKE